MPKGSTIVVGLGNPILGDDGAGFHVAEAVRRVIGDDAVTVETLAVGGIALMEHLIGYDRAIVVDIINSGKAPCGSVSCFRLEELENPFYGHLGSAHETNLQTALEIGRLLGASLPEVVTVVAIESPYVYDFSEELSPPVASAVSRAAQMVLNQLDWAGEPVGSSV